MIHYYKRIQCDNCGREEEYSIPKGKTVEEFSKETACGYCGCNLLPSEEYFQPYNPPYAPIPYLYLTPLR